MGQNCLLADQVYSLFSCCITRFFLPRFFYRDYLFWSFIVTPYQVYTKKEKFEVGRLSGNRKFHFVVVL